MGLSKLGIASRRVWGGAPALALCALLVSMAAAHAVDPPAGRIIGGSETTTEKWPWQAALTREGVFACGGSLISPDIVLTAAHCAQDPNGDPTPSESLRAVFGLDDLSDEGDPDAFAATVRESFISPQFEPSRLGAGFDFALLLLDAPLGRARIDLATGADGRRFDEHDKVLTTGWGLIDGNPATNTSVLHQGDVRLVDCSSTFGFSDSLLFCSAGGDGSCFGDSGGPLMIKTGPGTFRQIGISSFSDVSCEHMHAWTNVVDGPVRRALDEGIATLRSLPPAQPGPADGDSTAPQTKITKAPKAKIRTRKRRVAVTIKFRASEPSTFKCSLDGKRPRRCSSPLGFRVRKGPHRFQVFATDTAGNADPIPDTAGWRVKRIR